MGNEELNTASISVRGVLNTLAKNLNSDDPRPTIMLGRGDPTEFAAFRTAPPAADAVSDALQSFKFNSYCPTGGVLEARRYVLSCQLSWIVSSSIYLLHQHNRLRCLEPCSNGGRVSLWMDTCFLFFLCKGSPNQNEWKIFLIANNELKNT